MSFAIQETGYTYGCISILATVQGLGAAYVISFTGGEATTAESVQCPTFQHFELGHAQTGKELDSPFEQVNVESAIALRSTIRKKKKKEKKRKSKQEVQVTL